MSFGFFWPSALHSEFPGGWGSSFVPEGSALLNNVRWPGAVVLLFLLSATAIASGPAVEGIGAGAFPLSAEIVSMWFGHHPAGGGPRPVVIVYFIGQPGWHDRPWQSSVQLDAFPAHHELSSSNVRLHVSVDVHTNDVVVQRSRFHLSNANVFAVVHADQGPAARVVALGRFELRDSDEPASIAALRDHETLGQQLLSSLHHVVTPE